MEVVINKCHGGFGLSDEAIERCVELGMILCSEAELNAGVDADFFAWEAWRGMTEKYTSNDDPDRRNRFRSDPRLVRVVREMGDAANGSHAELKVIDIPFNDTPGWEVEECDGLEWIAEIHRAWS